MEEPLVEAAVGAALFEAAAVAALVEAEIVAALDFGVADGLLVLLLELQAAMIELNSAMVTTAVITDRAVGSKRGRDLNCIINSSVCDALNDPLNDQTRKSDIAYSTPRSTLPPPTRETPHGPLCANVSFWEDARG